jgi:hypothetical protein
LLWFNIPWQEKVVIDNITFSCALPHLVNPVVLAFFRRGRNSIKTNVGKEHGRNTFQNATDTVSAKESSYQNQ